MIFANNQSILSRNSFINYLEFYDINNKIELFTCIKKYLTGYLYLFYPFR